MDIMYVISLPKNTQWQIYEVWPCRPFYQFLGMAWGEDTKEDWLEQL